jgi:DNA-binding GntR family transcriptional regulator
MRATRLSEQAYEHVKRLLLEGRLSVDTWLPIEEIAAEIGSSRQPIMDAMKRLVMEGFIEIVPQVGCRVRSPEIREIEDFFRFFASGEALIAELAARRAEPSDVLALQLISGQVGQLIRVSKKKTEIGENYRLLNRQLHSEMRRISRSKPLADIVESLGDRSDFYVASVKRPVFALNVAQAHKEHEEIIEAIARHDEEGARYAMEKHIFATEMRVLDDFAKVPQIVKPASKRDRSAGETIADVNKGNNG